MTGRIRVYEIEHDGDVDNATVRIRAAGATSVKMVQADFDCSESALFEVTVADDQVERFREVQRRTEFMFDA